MESFEKEKKNATFPLLRGIQIKRERKVEKMKAEFLKYLDTNCILVLEGTTKKAVLEEIIALATTRCTLDESQLRELIWKREKMMTTGVGRGLALPHIRVPGFPVPLVMSESARIRSRITRVLTMSRSV